MTRLAKSLLEPVARTLELLLLIVVSLGLSWIYLGSTGEKESWRFVWIGLGWATGLSANVDTRDAKWGAVFAGQIQLMLLVISLVCLGLPQKPLLFLLVWLSHTSAIMRFVYLDVASVTKCNNLKEGT
ncbi:MAG: hypothetical protein ACPLUL_02285 [Thermanaerothrix sp.]|uniref:hypothetical protein n=1 Tax=Thermanaerothrix sp. TaxID=2972675 RepID=UPI003C7B349A